MRSSLPSRYINFHVVNGKAREYASAIDKRYTSWVFYNTRLSFHVHK